MLVCYCKVQKVCVLCNKNSIGDEFHYILECGYFKKQRSRYLDQPVSPNVISLSKIFSDSDRNKLLKLSKFCGIILNTFKSNKKSTCSTVTSANATNSHTHISSRGRVITKPKKLNLWYHAYMHYCCYSFFSTTMYNVLMSVDLTPSTVFTYMIFFSVL